MAGEPDPWIVGGEHGHDVGRVVGRAVIDDDELPVAQGLGLQGADGARHEGGLPVRRHDDAHDRHGRLLPSASIKQSASIQAA